MKAFENRSLRESTEYIEYHYFSYWNIMEAEFKLYHDTYGKIFSKNILA